MATGTVSSRPPKESAPNQGRYGDFIQERLEQTRRQVRLVDFGSGIVLLLAASFFFFLVVALADHWLFAHGLNFFARLLLFVVWMAGAGWFTWRAVAPSIMHRINPVFAAQTIEHGRPTLKNSLINFLLLRSHPENVAPIVYQAMEHRAATDLSRVPIDQAVDHRRFIHLCYALAAAVVLFALYMALSPKNPLVSAARVIWPFGSLAAPTRVHIEDVQPGDTVIYQGDRPAISAHVSGLRDGEQVSLLMTTADGQIVDDRVTMNHTDEGNRYACELPPGSGGLLQSTTYRINAGDATTQPFKLDVEIAPTINVDQVDYHFPAYAGMMDRSIKGQGDIKALEGTRVTIHATANVELKTARIDLGCLGLRMIAMSLNGRRATGEFTLAADQPPGQAWKPLFDRYQIILTDSEDHQARRRPIQYRIDVDRDYPPEITIVEPKSETVDVSASGHVRIRLHSSDDFGLRRVAINALRNGVPLDSPVLLDRLPPDKALAKPFDADYDFSPAAFHLMKGDEVKYWIEADDNKEPKHNHAETAHRTIRIVDKGDAGKGQANNEQGPGEQQQPGEGQPQKGNNGGRGKAEKDAGNSSDKAKDGSNGESSPDNKGGSEGSPSKSQSPEKGTKGDPSKSEKGNDGKDKSSSDSKDSQKGESESSNGGEQGSKRTDPKSQPVDAMKEIAKHMDEQQKEQEKKQSPSENSKSGQQNAGDQQNAKQENGNQQQGNQQAGNQQGGGEQSGNQQSAKQQSGNQQAGNQQDGNQQSGNQQGANQQNGDQKAGNQQAGNQPSGNRQSGNQQAGGQQSGKQQSGNQQAGNQQNGASGSQARDQAKSSAGSKNDGGSSGSENKPDKQGGGSKGKEQSTSGGAQPAKEKQAGDEKGGSQSGGSQSNAKTEKKPSGSGGSDDKNQLAMKSGDPKTKNPSQGGSDVNRETPGGSSKPENTPKPQSNNAGSGGQNSQQQKPEKKEQSGSGGAGGEQKPQPGGGEQPEPGSGKSSPSGTKSGKPGNMAEGDPGQKDPGRNGEPSNQNSGQAPAPQMNNSPGEKKAGDSNNTGQKPNDPQSPGNGEKTSDSKGESEGDRKGGGAGGGGGDQHSKKNGRGTPGAHSVGGEDGGQVSNESGPGATGKKAGETAKTTDNTASPHKEAGSGNGEKTEPDKQSSNDSQSKPNNSPQNPSNTPQNAGGGQLGAPSTNPAAQQGTGLPAGGSSAGNQPPAPQSKTASQDKADEADLQLSKNQVDMALRHLKDETSKPKSDLLDRLGWTPEEAKKFAENIEKLRDSAKQPGSEGEKNYSEFLKDLGLRPHGTRIEGSKSKADDFHGVRDAPQMEPPAEWDEITRGYSQTTATGQK